ncbi:hypothetical protein ACQKKX_06250 [Neorhizobium sp. NPDC001467]
MSSFGRFLRSRFDARATCRASSVILLMTFVIGLVALVPMLILQLSTAS